MALFPIGEEMAHNFVKRGNLFWLLLFAFLLGFGTTAAEPALIAIADEAAEIAANEGLLASNEAAMASYALGLRMAVALAVGLAIVIGVNVGFILIDSIAAYIAAIGKIDKLRTGSSE